MAMYQSDSYDYSEQEIQQNHTPMINVIQIDFPFTDKTPQKIDLPNIEPSNIGETQPSKSPGQRARTKNIRKEKRKPEKRTQNKPEKKTENKGENISKKRQRDERIKPSMGRPDNHGVQGPHLKESKSYNDIVYHFARFLIFLKIKQSDERTIHVPNLTAEQNQWMGKVENIMSQDNYPKFQDQKPSFLLHPNSPHYVFGYLKGKENKTVYSSEETQSLMIAYLTRKNILTATIYNYLCDYWRDIVFLVNNPKGDNILNNIPQEFEPEISQPQEMPDLEQNNENIDQNGGRKKGPSESDLLRQELLADDSIAAYQIACYLHACCAKFEVKIVS